MDSLPCWDFNNSYCYHVPRLRVQCLCGSCGTKKYGLSEWERHTGCRAKKWKHSVKVKGSNMPLEKWVCS